MIEVHSDKLGELLIINFAEKVTADDAEKWVNQIQVFLAGMQPGFRLLADLSAMDSMDVACAPFIAKFMDRCNERGVSKVIRIIPDPRKDIGLNIMSRFHYNRDIRILTFKNISEARNALAAGTE